MGKSKLFDVQMLSLSTISPDMIEIEGENKFDSKWTLVVGPGLLCKQEFFSGSLNIPYFNSQQKDTNGTSGAYFKNYEYWYVHLLLGYNKNSFTPDVIPSSFSLSHYPQKHNERRKHSKKWYN